MKSARFLFLFPLLCIPSHAEEPAFELGRWKPLKEGPVFTGVGGASWDRQIRERGWILREGDEYHLWYTGYNNDLSDNRFLGHAVSRDGIQWKRDPRPLLTDSWVEDMCVVKHEGTYYMFAEGRNDVAHVLTSTDKLRWEERGPLDVRKVNGEKISPGPYGTPTVWVENGIWYLFYERGDLGVWLATSKDRKIWTNVQDDPVLKMGPEVYDRAAVAMNQVIRRGDWYYAVYHANAHRPWKAWTTCLARSKDLVRWEKSPENPIVENNCSSGILVDAFEGIRLYTMHPDVRAFRPTE